MSAPVAIVAGASRGLGGALCAALTGRGFRAAAVGRQPAIDEVAAEVAGVTAIACDLAAPREVERAFARIEGELGPPEVVIYNAHRLDLQSFTATSAEVFEASWRAGCLGAFVVAKRALAGMVERGRGTLIFTGATGSLRGGRRSAAFSSSKFALRGLAQSLAREFAPAGVHVAHVVLDGLVWSDRTRSRFDPKPEDCMAPAAVAAAYCGLIAQERSAWTHELDLRPWKERF